MKHFDTTSSAARIHPLETGLAYLVGFQVVFMAWSLGAVHLWAQLVAASLSAASLIVALWVRTYDTALTGNGEFKLYPIFRLVRFPIFWLGLALLAYIAIQGFNPAWEYQTNGKTWWMRRIPHVSWLPHGVRMPFTQTPGLPQGGQWRNLLVYSTALMTVCAIWSGFTRTRTVVRLITILATNGAIFCAFALTQKLLHARGIFWVIPSRNPAFFGSFIYKNHAAAFLVLTLSTVIALAAWSHNRSTRRMEKSSPAPVCLFIATLIALGIVISLARAATVVTIVYLLSSLVTHYVKQRQLPPASRNTTVTLALLAVFLGFISIGAYSLKASSAIRHIDNLFSGQDISVFTRHDVNLASMDMLKDHWTFGVGSGAFPTLFTIYQQHYPRIMHEYGHGMYWDHAHNDLVEFPIELGIPGTLIIFAALAYYFYTLFRNRFVRDSVAIHIVPATVLVLLSAGVDFLLQNPAVLVMWCVCVTLSALSAYLQEQKRNDIQRARAR